MEPKIILSDSKNMIAKSNDLAISRFDKELSQRQVQLLTFAILKVQKENKISFTRKEFLDFFGISESYSYEDGAKDTKNLSGITVSWVAINGNRRLHNTQTLITGSTYDEGGIFTFIWNVEMLPHIQELKEKFVSLDIKMTNQFKNKHSWKLYEVIKAHYRDTTLEITRENLLRLFTLETKKTYQKNFSNFKSRVLDKVIEDINVYSEYTIWYEEVMEKYSKRVEKIVFKWVKGKIITSATEDQYEMLCKVVEKILLKGQPIAFTDLAVQKEIYGILMRTVEVKNLLETNSLPANQVTNVYHELLNFLKFIEQNLDKQTHKGVNG